MSATDLSIDPQAVLPVVQPLAKKPAHTTLYRRLIEEGVDEPVAAAVARAVVDPADARQRLDRLVPMRVPGGRLYSLDVTVWAPAITSFPVNNREAPGRTFPAAGTVADPEATRFRPLRPAQDAADGSARLEQHAASGEHVVWSFERSVKYLLDHNPLVESIAAQGVMVAVTAVPTTLRFSDGTPPVTVLATADGSSRVTSCHDLLDLTPRDVVFDLPADDRAFRGALAEALAVLERPADEVSDEDLRKVRALQVPARILLRFEPDAGIDTGFAKAVEALVHLLHVEPPKAWDDAASLDAKADSVLAALHDTGELTPNKRAYADGMLTPDEARDVGLGGEADERALWLLRLISDDTAAIKRAVRAGVLELTRGKAVRKETKAQIAVELGLRAVRASHPAAFIKSARLALQSAYQSDLLWGKELGVAPKAPEQLRDEAMAELADGGEPGAACARLAVQGGFWLAVHRVLREAHFFADRDKRDGRSPQKILEALAASTHGVHVLYRALVDGRDGQPPTAVDSDGRRRKTVDSKLVGMSSGWVRNDVVPPGGRRTEGPQPEAFPTRQLLQHVQRLRNAVTALDDEHAALRKVTDASGTALVDREGINSQTIAAMRQTLDKLDRRLILYEDVWTRANQEEARDDDLDTEPALDEIDEELLDLRDPESR